jgi:hypothetical protein
MRRWRAETLRRAEEPLLTAAMKAITLALALLNGDQLVAPCSFHNASIEFLLQCFSGHRARCSDNHNSCTCGTGAPFAFERDVHPLSHDLQSRASVIEKVTAFT